jgi:hypothetical protein
LTAGRRRHAADGSGVPQDNAKPCEGSAEMGLLGHWLRERRGNRAHGGPGAAQYSPVHPSRQNRGNAGPWTRSYNERWSADGRELTRRYPRYGCTSRPRARALFGPERRASRSPSSADRSELFVLGLRLHGACGVTVDARHGAEWTASVRQVLRRLTIRTEAMEPSSKQDDRDSSAALVRARGRAHPPTFDRAGAT